MERSADGLGEMLQSLGIQQPKLEDAGLEDCALPPDSITEAFSRAASSLKSRVTKDETHGGGCVQYPGPTNGETPDALVGVGGGNVTAGDMAEDRVLVLGGDERAFCPGGGDDVIGREKKGDLDVDDDGDGRDYDKPILVEALI